MRRLFSIAASGLFLLALAACDDDAAAPSPSPTVAGEREVAAIPPEVSENEDQWPLPNKDYANTRATLESEIDSQNVNDLAVAWTFAIPGSSQFGSAASNPLIAGDTVYFQDLASNVFALELEGGDLLWEQRYEEKVVGPNGPAIGWGKVFVHSGIDSFAALNIETGEELWRTEVEEATGAQQPSVFRGMMYAASQAGSVAVDTDPGEELASRGYAPGTTGVIYAIDQENGEMAWKFQVVTEGFWGNPEVNSGGGVWYPPAIETQTGVTYWGTGNPAPFPGIDGLPNGTSRPGPELYANSIVALDHENGELLWYNLVKPDDLFDLDFQAPRILTTAEIAGEQREIVIGSGKLGRIIAFERENGSMIWDTPVGRHQNDELRELTVGEPLVVFPGVLGGVETPMAYADGVVYAPVVNLGTEYEATAFGAEDGTEALANAVERTDLAAGEGEIVAVDVSTGNVLWSHPVDSPPFGGATVVNDLLFASTFDGRFFALDRETGEEVWSFQAPGGINAWPAVADDTIVLPVGVGDSPQLMALRLEAEERTPTPAETPTETPEATVAPAPEGTPTATPAPDGEEVELQLTALNIAFDRSEVTVPAGAAVTMEFTNQDALPHNFALYTDESAQEPIFVGEIFTGPDATRTYEFEAPSETGTYFFRCDVHPLQMTGDFVVE